jgi:thiol-disulfide isomerase/thioredoxin
MKKIRVVAVLLILIITLVFSFGIRIGNFSIGKVKDFNNTYNKDIENSVFYKEYYTSDKLLVINLWATWCKPCIEEMPALNRLKDKYKNSNDVEFLSLSLDNDSLKIKKFINNQNFHFRDITLDNIKYRDTILALLENKRMSIIKTQSIPKTFLIRNMKLIMKIDGKLNKEDFEVLERTIN